MTSRTTLFMLQWTVCLLHGLHREILWSTRRHTIFSELIFLSASPTCIGMSQISSSRDQISSISSLQGHWVRIGWMLFGRHSWPSQMIKNDKKSTMKISWSLSVNPNPVISLPFSFQIFWKVLKSLKLGKVQTARTTPPNLLKIALLLMKKEH